MKLMPRGMMSKYTGEMKVFIWASMINSTGGALMWPLTTLFVHTQLNRPLADAGFVILMQMLGGFFGQLLGGGLYYRLGVRKLLIGALAATSLLQLSLVVTAHADWWLYVMTMTVLGLTNSASMPAIQSFVGFRWADRRDELFNVIYVGNNVGVALGTALSGVLADISFNLTFVLNGLTSAGFALFFYRFLRGQSEESAAAGAVNGTVETGTPVNGAPANGASVNGTLVNGASVKGTLANGESADGANGEEKTTAARAQRGILPERSIWEKLSAYRIYLFMSVGALFIWLANSLWGTGVAPHIADQGMNFSMYSLLWTLNGVLIFAAQPITSWMKRTIAVPLTSQLTWSAIFYGLAYVVIWFLPFYSGFLLAMALATLGEMLVSPAVPAFLSARAGREAPFYMGVSGGIASIGRMIGPYVLGLTYDHGGLDGVSFISVFIAVLAVLSFIMHAALQRKERSPQHDMMMHG
ncbi:MFS transporter [Paenibacillus thiaminolyticus]|uniref:MFS transporter n=2 Tax=Paenibacillus thiaminolyticus TaxID=49283 RepID=A0ABT4FUH7_PANTH|nr:MFS transporter [Paenibacillus thiaminolyticus]MCY9533774.1 MFS transporter [Paenibacillus thiaminolyticus]MCY9600266.1 MFS transporter [Paenibacillus thiaminolyticus]MCY9607825.1 MFS transporter [Paenibacillus thiaminolyticus]MCY9611922.1 MFS transporter [Paenibacillus thiaminolyticus]MCY9617858.1 MFS transporter [Paenibacillus thiaminolyticus]